MSQEFVGQSELQEYAERNGAEYVWEYTRTFAKWQRLLAPEQYKIVEVRTSRGLSRAMLFSKTILQAERQEPAPVHEATAALASVPQHPHNIHTMSTSKTMPVASTIKTFGAMRE
jgi:hypothetical protein